VRQNSLRILFAAIVVVAAMPAVAGTPTGGPGIQQGPVIGTRVLEKPDLVARSGSVYGRTILYPMGACKLNPKAGIDARERLYITSKGELVFRVHLGVKNRGLTPAKNFTSRLRTTNLGVNNTVSVHSVARLNPGATTTQIFEMPFFLKDRYNVDLEFTVNYNNRVRERTMGNNTCRMKLEFTNNKYDFAIQSFRFNRMAPTCVSGQPVYYFDVTVKNKGSGWLTYSAIVNSIPLVVEDKHAPFYGNPYPGWGAIVGLVPYTGNSPFKPGEVRQFQVGVGYHRNDPAHMSRGSSHPFQASIRSTTAKSVTLSIRPPTACRGGQPAQLKGLPARSKSKKRAPRTVKPVPAKPLPRR
jgi:CARDB